PGVLLIQFILSLSAAYVVATLQVRFRDTSYLLGLFLFLFFYVTPVFWDVELISEPMKSYMYLNPVAQLLGAYRGILIRSTWPSPLTMAVVATAGLVMLWMSYSLFLRARDRFVEEL